MDEQGIIKNNTLASAKKSDDADNESQKGDHSPILVMIKPGEHKPRYFRPVTIEDPDIENISKESEENTLRRRRFPEDNNTPKEQENQTPFYELLMKNLKQRLDNFDPNKNFQTSDIFSVSDLYDDGRKFQNDDKPKETLENPTTFYGHVMKNYGDHLSNPRNKTSKPDDIYGIEELLERQRKLFKTWGIDDTSLPSSFYNPPIQYPEYKPYDFKLPVFDPPKVDLDYSAPSHRLSKSGVWFISVVAFAIIMFVLKLLARPRTSRSERRRQREREQQAPVTAPTTRPRNNTQRRRRRDQQDPPLAPQPNEPYGSLARLVSSDFSAEIPEADLPPTYAECATNNDEIVNVHIDRPKSLIADEPPPPYSACLGLFPNTDNSSDKSQSNNHLQSSSVTDRIHSNVIETSLTTDVGQSNTNIEMSSVSHNEAADTTITIINENVHVVRINVPQ